MKKDLFKRRRPARTLTVSDGAFKVEIYQDTKRFDRNYIDITAEQANFRHRVAGYSFGYLLSSLADGDTHEIEAYCYMLLRISEDIYRDPQFCKDIVSAIQGRHDRLWLESKAQAQRVTEEQEQASQTLMEDIVAETSMSDEQIAAKREEEHELMRQIINKESENADEEV